MSFWFYYKEDISSDFATILWKIWKDKNKKGFDNIDAAIPYSFKVITTYSLEIVEAL